MVREFRPGVEFVTILSIGSTAARVWFPDWRSPKDYDAFADEKLAVEQGDIFWDDRFDLLFGGEERTATPDELYTIKHSHAYWELKNGSWPKHMLDLLELQKRGATLIPQWHDVLYKVWEDRHGKKVVDLSEESDEFFADAVTRAYDHDSLHRSVAYEPGKPLYEEALKPGKSVEMDMAKVWSWPFDKIVRLFREEIYVTALERKIVPSDYQGSAGAAYQWALRRTITSLTKGRSAQFLVTNFEQFRSPGPYVDRHLANSQYLIRLEAA